MPRQIEGFYETIFEGLSYVILYDRETKVIYHMSTGVYNNGNLTPLYNADGTLRVWGEQLWTIKIHASTQTNERIVTKARTIKMKYIANIVCSILVEADNEEEAMQQATERCGEIEGLESTISDGVDLVDDDEMWIQDWR